MKPATTRTTRSTAAASKIKAPNSTPSTVIKAFLRIRPALHIAASPYLEVRDERSVTMTPPQDNSKKSIRINKRPAQTFSFDRIFDPSTLQEDLFKETALPLIESALLSDDSGLLFTYGVSNSGKTYSLQGEKLPAAQGIIPRTIETVFASVKGKQVEGQVGQLQDMYMPVQRQPFPPSTDAYSVQVDDGDQFAIWASFVEIYNEKVFDLLNEVSPGSSGAIKRQGLALKAGHIPDLKWFRVRTREEALAVFQAGQVNRQIFGTAQNRMSSRSHGIFELRIAKLKKDGSKLKQDMTIKICKLSMVDLAGSERTKNTQSTGERLREASHINTGLMTLGRCFEIMRSNQDNWKKKMHVPYKHSKLTEMFQSFFNGQGSAVMLVCVNPFDSTCFDENLHVMRFSAIAREVQTSNKLAVESTKIKLQAPGSSKEEEFELIEAEAESDEEPDALVTYLWDEVRSLRLQLLETQLQNATIEAEVREEVVKESEEHLAEMKAAYDRRLQMEIEAHEKKTDLKLDMMLREDSDSD